MATLAKKLYIGTPGTTSATLYTVPASTTAILKNIVLSNTTATAAIITIGVGGKNILTNYTVAANDTAVIDLSLVLSATDTVTGVQTTASAINVFLSGVEVV
ncbi:hypothetical protein RSA11_04295 [Exiguobacterium indicum]|uniref:Uncharacterized protein n=1 Tax=Exiguobacterium indicum TaxID=296995 RepID=A0AAW3MFK1_9BACL|nr:hypothetical protein [Exiguobacterium indicum]KTR27890.1 hypothetical protein RSA11_04295 [Exiguobacterium indicum]